ncbi:MAG: FlgD immunoglobulin-like domain containing protein, partial [Planctomycetota bacterium]
MKYLTGALAILLLVAGHRGDAAGGEGAAAAAEFAREPKAAREEKGVRISFEVAAPSDCTVWVVDEKGKTVRHLAAGVLGKTAPKPFKAGELAQSLLWDGKDDAGKPVPAGKYVVKVGLGTRPKFDRLIGHQPSWLGNIYAMVCDRQGQVYAYCSRGICVLDREGKY